ncbi:MAG: hypothetical protein WAW17_11015 [Rhodococcus sp. (in: high G+C Gram-positive bacteria)]|uniref:hypothetical protein n=1 Tax=Rhodococcus sp. TaxID=1831 RepID=UPI003BAF1F00
MAYVAAATVLPFALGLPWWGVPICYLVVLLITGLYVGEIALRFNVKVGQR